MKDPLAGPVSEDYPDGNFPIGEILDYPPVSGIDHRTAKDRFTSDEARALDRMHNDIYNEARQAAEAHRRTRKHIKEWVLDIFHYFFFLIIRQIKFVQCAKQDGD